MASLSINPPPSQPLQRSTYASDVGYTSHNRQSPQAQRRQDSVVGENQAARTARGRMDNPARCFSGPGLDSHVQSARAGQFKVFGLEIELHQLQKRLTDTQGVSHSFQSKTKRTTEQLVAAMRAIEEHEKETKRSRNVLETRVKSLEMSLRDQQMNAEKYLEESRSLEMRLRELHSQIMDAKAPAERPEVGRQLIAPYSPLTSPFLGDTAGPWCGPQWFILVPNLAASPYGTPNLSGTRGQYKDMFEAFLKHNLSTMHPPGPRLGSAPSRPVVGLPHPRLMPKVDAHQQSLSPMHGQSNILCGPVQRKRPIRKRASTQNHCAESDENGDDEHIEPKLNGKFIRRHSGGSIRSARLSPVPDSGSSISSRTPQPDPLCDIEAPKNPYDTPRPAQDQECEQEIQEQHVDGGADEPAVHVRDRAESAEGTDATFASGFHHPPSSPKPLESFAWDGVHHRQTAQPSLSVAEPVGTLAAESDMMEAESESVLTPEVKPTSELVSEHASRLVETREATSRAEDVMPPRPVPAPASTVSKQDSEGRYVSRNNGVNKTPAALADKAQLQIHPSSIPDLHKGPERVSRRLISRRPPSMRRIVLSRPSVPRTETSDSWTTDSDTEPDGAFTDAKEFLESAKTSVIDLGSTQVRLQKPAIVPNPLPPQEHTFEELEHVEESKLELKEPSIQPDDQAPSVHRCITSMLSRQPDRRPSIEFVLASNFVRSQTSPVPPAKTRPVAMIISKASRTSLRATVSHRRTPSSGSSRDRMPRPRAPMRPSPLRPAPELIHRATTPTFGGGAPLRVPARRPPCPYRFGGLGHNPSASKLRLAAAALATTTSSLEAALRQHATTRNTTTNPTKPPSTVLRCPFDGIVSV